MSRAVYNKGVMETKICTKCGIEKDVSCFGKAKNQCRDCANAQGKAYYAANKDKQKAQAKAYYAANRDKRNAQKKAYNAANKDKISAWQKAYNAANKDKRKAYNEKNLITRCMTEHGITEQAAIEKIRINRMFKSQGENNETRKQLMTMGIF